MNNKINPIKISLIITIPIILLILIGILFYINLSKTITIEGTIKYISKSYIIIKDINSKNEYKIKTNKEYQKNDKIKVTLYKINNNSDPKEATIKEEEIIENIETNNLDKENEIINYFIEVDNELDNYKEDKTIYEKEELEYQKIINFLFYDEKINEESFNNQTNINKIKLLKITMSIENKINKIISEQKETKEEKYQNIKAKIITKYLDITVEACENNEETCEEAKKGLTELKNNLYVSWAYIKNISDIEPERQKRWYEIWKII